MRDNASNISLGVRLSKSDNIGCFCHTIHLIVTHVTKSQPGVKLLRTRLRNLVEKLQTFKGKNRLKLYQQRAGVSRNSMSLSGETRWKSEYVMLERA